MIGHELGLCQIRRTLQTYGEGVQTGPVGLGFRIILNTHLGIFLGDGRDDAAVETTREQYTVRHVAHELALHCIFEGIVDGLDRGGIVFHCVVLHPVTTIIPFYTRRHAPIVMTRQERFVTFALSFKGFQFGSHVDSTVTVVAYIKRYNANGIAGNEELIALLVIEHKGEDATQVFEEIDAFLTIECQNDFTVGTCLELILACIATPNLLMIVDFSIDG